MAVRSTVDMTPCCQGRRYRAEVRQLLPEPAEIDPFIAHAAASRPAPEGRPWMALNMVASADGAIAVEGRSGGLGSDADHAVFRAIRGIADVIIAGAGTVRAEGYGPPRPSEAVQAARVARGQAPVPRLAIVSGSLDLDETEALFTEAQQRPLIFTGRSAGTDRPDRLDALRTVADVHLAGEGSDVDMTAMASQLGALGVRCAVVEGGPALNGHLLAHDLIDELNLTVAPVLVGGAERRAIVGATDHLARMDLAHLWESEGNLLARYVRAGSPTG